MHQERAARGNEVTGEQAGFARRVLIAVGIAALVTLVLLLLWHAVDVFLLIFAGVLLALFLRGVSDWIAAHTPLSGSWSLAVVTLALLSLLSAVVLLLAPNLAEQAHQLAESLPRALARLQQVIARYAWGQQLLAQMPNLAEFMPRRADVLAKVTGVFSTTLGLIVNIVIVLFLGLYFAVSPRLYTDGLVRLITPARRARARVVLQAIGHRLRLWLVGRVILMVVNGAFTMLGLWLLGVPLALTLGLLAGLLNFIPNLGPILAGVPAVLVALTQSPTQALYVFLLYLFLQSADGYVLTPLVQKRTVALPPALTIAAQMLMGVLLGGLGILLATPLAAVILVLVKLLYVEDTLGDRTDEV